MQLIIKSSMRWPLCSVHRMDAPARVEFVLGLICLPSVFFAIIEIQIRGSRRDRSGSRGERVAEDPRWFRSMRGQHGKLVDNPCRSFRLDRGTGLDCPAFVPHFPRRGRPEATPPEHPGLPSHRSRRTGVCLDRRAAVRTNSDESNSQQISIRRRQRRFGSRPSAPDEKNGGHNCARQIYHQQGGVKW